MAHQNHIPAPRNTIETYSSRPERDPPRNDKGEIVCQHPSCQGKNEVFRRPCEFNKHMDKHERPYKCSETTCEQNPGFTYSGGLLRHMREVHKKGVGPARKPLYCPHANCIRSSGEGFTRRENLEEHLRRRHSFTGNYSPSRSGSSPSPSNDDNSEQPRKRRRTTESEIDVSPTQAEEAPVPKIEEPLDRDQAVLQLSLARAEIARQAEAIRTQEKELTRLRTLIAALPSGTIYESKKTPPQLNGVGHAVTIDGDVSRKLPLPPIHRAIESLQAPT